MPDPVWLGEDVSPGRYLCTACGFALAADGPVHLSPCPECHNHHWIAQSGGEPVAEDGDPWYDGC